MQKIMCCNDTRNKKILRLLLKPQYNLDEKESVPMSSKRMFLT